MESTRTNDLYKSNLRGNIKKITEVYRDPTDPEPAESKRASDSRTTIEYNTAGNMTLLVVHEGLGLATITRDEYEYDETGTIITNSVSLNMNNRTFKQYTYEYDRKGRIVSESSPGENYSIIYKYTRDNRVKSEKFTVLQNTGKPETSEKRYKYTPSGRLKHVLDGSRSHKYYYDREGNLSFIVYDDGQEERFDRYGNMTSLIKPVTFKGDGTTGDYITKASVEAVYEYDVYGNWIKRTQYFEGEVIGETVREIEYY